MGDRSVFYKTIGVNTEDEEDKNAGKRGDRSVFYSTVQEDKKQTPEPASASAYDSLILPTPQQWAERDTGTKKVPDTRASTLQAPSYTPLVMRMAEDMKSKDSRTDEKGVTHDNHSAMHGVMQATKDNPNPAADYYTKEKETGAQNLIMAKTPGLAEKKQELDRLRKERNEGSAAYASGDLTEAMAQWEQQQATDKRIKELETELKDKGVDASDSNGVAAAHGAIWRGMSQIETPVYKGLDFINRMIQQYGLGMTPEEYESQNTVTHQLAKHGEKNLEYWDKYTQKNQGDSKAADIANKVVSGSVAALPTALMAIMSGGTTAGISAAQGISGAGATAADLATIGNAAATTGKAAAAANSARLAVTEMVKDPQYWFSVLNTVGDGYEQAKADGASEDRAVLYATVNGLVNAMIEIGGGGIQELPKELRNGGMSGVRAWVDSMFDEGKEEVVQGVMERGLQFLYGKNNKVFSMNDPDAIFNPKTAAQEFGMGAAVSALLGGGQIALNTGINKAADKYSSLQLPSPAKVAGNENAAQGRTAENLALPDPAKVAGNEKAAPEGTAEDLALPEPGKQNVTQIGKSLYSQEEANAIRHEGKTFRNLIAGFDTTVSDFFGKWKNGRKSHLGEKLEKLYIGRLSEAELQRVSEILGYDMTDRDVILTNDDIKHIHDDHPNLSSAAMEAIPEVIASPDSIDGGHEGSGKNSGKTGVIFQKMLPNGNVVVIQFDNPGRGTMQITSVYETEKAKTTIPKATAEDSTIARTPEASGSEVLAKNNVSQLGQNVKTGLELPEVQTQEQGQTAQPQDLSLPSPEQVAKGTTAQQQTQQQTEAKTLPTPEEWKNRGTEAQPAETETGEPMQAVPETPEAPEAPEGPAGPEEMSDGGRSVNGYAASPGLRKLGVKIAEPITDTIGADVLVSQAQKAKAAEKALNKAIKKLAPTKAEKALAQGLADGTYTEGNGILYGKDGAPIRDVNMNKVRELAEYYRQKNQYKRDRIAEQRRANRDRETAIDEDLLKYADNFKKMSALRLNLNTMKRNMLAWAGQTLGAKINQHLFDPVTQNSAERIRFVNRMLDRVREFHLSKAESEMVQRVIEGTAVQDQVSKLTEDARRRVNAAAESNDLNLTAAEYNLSAEEKKLAQRYHDWLQTQAQLKNMDADKINAAAKAYSDAYSDFYTAINEFLVMHGYEPIGFIQGYAPHLQPDNVQSTLGKVMSIFGLDAEVSALPTDIAGQTENYKPGKQWNPYFQHRAGADSMIDAVAGYESYVNYLSNVLYHTDDIQKLRTFIRTLRGMYASEEIREKLDQAKWIKGRSAEEKADFLRINKMIDEGTQLTPEMANDLIDKYVDGLYDSIENKTKHGDVASVLEDYTNKLAGKQTKLDRAVESFFGRSLNVLGIDISLNFGNKLSRIFGESAVVGNLSSALNQLSQLPAVQAEVGNKYVLRAIGDILKGNTAVMDQESDFLTGKLGTDSLLAERSWKDSDSKQRRAKVTNAMSIPFEAVDTLASRLYVRAKYLQEIENGATHEAAMKAADDFAERVVGNRIQGSRPMVFESKNAIVKLFSTFQLEVANAWAHISQDLPAEIKAVEKSQGKAAAVQRTAAILMRYGISAFLLNRLTDAIYGGTPAPFDLIGYVLGGIAEGKGESVNEYLIQLVSDLFGLGGDDDEDEEKEFDVGAALKETGSLLVGDMPYIRNAASMLGYGDTTLPLPSVGKTAKSLSDLVSGKGSWGDVGESALRDAATWLPGGNQAKKTAQGIETIAKQGRYNKSGNLMYPVDMSGAEGLAKAMKAGLFGPSSLGATDSYYASGDKELSEKQTAAYENLVKIGEDRNAVYDTIMRFRKVKDVTGSDEDGKARRDVLRSADMSDYSKARLYETLFSSEGKYEKLAGLMDTGITFDDCMDIEDKYNEQKYTGEKPGIQASRFAQWVDQTYEPEVAEKIKEQYSYWTNVRAEPSAYEKAQAAGVDIDTAAAAMEIKNAAKGKKDENGETIDGTKKAEVIRGVDALDCSEEDKIKLLEKSEYKMDGYNRVSFFMSLSDYADAVELQAMATGKKDDQGRTISGSKELEVMKGVNFLNKDLTPREKTRVMQALGYDTDDADKAPMIWDTDYTGKDYEAYYYLTGSQRQGFEKYCDWMPVQDYAKYADSIGEFQTIKDKNGKTTVSRQDQVIEYINALNLTPDQKTALYVASGYNPNLTDNAFKVCPWWNRLALRSEYYPTK